ncbi:MAG: spore maturation protein [Oscillospiraceae bacterium]|nr:spore maturation protein [Oscillospiraceae bacterium]
MIYVIPAIIVLVLTVSLTKKLPSYEIFIDGVEEGMKIVIGIFPPLLAVLTAAYMLRASGTLDLIISFLSPLTNLIPAEVMPLALIRPVSGSGAIGILTEILSAHGADSEIGRIASVIMGSTETTFYCLCVYFAKTRVKHNLRAMPFAAAGDIVSILMAVILIKLVKI